MKLKFLFLSAFLSGCTPLTPDQIDDLRYLGAGLNQAGQNFAAARQQYQYVPVIPQTIVVRPVPGFIGYPPVLPYVH